MLMTSTLLHALLENQSSAGGVRGRTEATGLGVFYGIREFLNNSSVLKHCGLRKGLEDKTIIVQGFGNVGYYTCKYFHEASSKVIGVIEYNGGIYNTNGIDISSLSDHWNRHGTFKDFNGGTFHENGIDIMCMNCDILIPAALEKQVNVGNAKSIKAKVIGEAANGPLTPNSDEILRKRGCVIIPDFYLNAGGVTVSYFEYLKNLSHVRFGRLSKKWEERSKEKVLDMLNKATGYVPTEHQKEVFLSGADEADLVYSGLEGTMINAAKETISTEQSRNLNGDYRTAAFLNAIEKINKVTTACGDLL